MPPKKTKGGVSKVKAKEERHEDALQAVVLADTFERRFSPLTNTRPRCLLPLANTPLIDYTLEFIAYNGIQDVLVYCGAHTDQVEEYLEHSRWCSPTSPFTSLEIIRTEAASVGDAMRDLDSRDLIKGDFVLVSGDVVANISIEAALLSHRARRQKDANSIMTMILREIGPGKHRAASHSNRTVFYIDEEQERCLNYEEVPYRRRRKRRSSSSGLGKRNKSPKSEDEKEHPRLRIDDLILKYDGDVEIMGNIIDPHIDICTPDVLSLWSDNFDYQTLRTSFLPGVLKDYELNGKKLHVHLMKQGYAARVRSMRMYDTVSRDILEGWALPFRPDSNLNGETYKLLKRKVYTEKGVVLAKSSRIVKKSAVGANTSIGEGSEIIDSTIGRGCIIGKNVSIRNSYIWDSTLIEDGAVLDHNLVAAEAVVGKNVKLEPGAIISFGVRIQDNSVVSGDSTLAQPEGISSNVKSAPKDLEYDSETSDVSSTSAASAKLYTHPNVSTGSLSSVSTLHDHADLDYLTDDMLPEDGKTPIDRRDSIASSGGASDAGVRRDFVREVTASLLDGMAQAQSADVIHLDVMNQRLTADASDSAVREALVAGFMRRIFVMHDDEGAAAGDAANRIFKTYGGKILRQMAVRTGSGDADMKSDEVNVLNGIERECQNRSDQDKMLAFTITAAYNADVVGEDAILGWWKEGGEDTKPGRSEAKKMVEYLEEEDEESEEEESEEEESDSD